MSKLAALAVDNSIKDEEDRLSVGGPLDTGIYHCVVKAAYLTNAASGAMALNLILKADNDREIRQQLWMTSGKAKGMKNYYERDGVKTYLPGFVLANGLARLAAGDELSNMDTETRAIKLYNKESKKEEATNVDMVVDLVGKDIKVGLFKQTVDKTAKNEQTGEYEPTGETREENEIDKLFHAESNMTVAEVLAGASEAAFYERWLNKHPATYIRNKAKGAAEGAGKTGAPTKTASTRPTGSLFKKAA